MAKLDPQIVAHLEWIGFIRPTGLVVSAPALVEGLTTPLPVINRSISDLLSAAYRFIRVARA